VSGPVVLPLIMFAMLGWVVYYLTSTAIEANKNGDDSWKIGAVLIVGIPLLFLLAAA